MIKPVPMKLLVATKPFFNLWDVLPSWILCEFGVEVDLALRDGHEGHVVANVAGYVGFVVFGNAGFVCAVRFHPFNENSHADEVEPTMTFDRKFEASLVEYPGAEIIFRQSRIIAG